MLKLFFLNQACALYSGACNEQVVLSFSLQYNFELLELYLRNYIFRAV